ncbi:DNA repair protein RadA [subsurface metagenome]
MKSRPYYECKVCQHHEPKWLGRCPECGSWNSLEEQSTPAGKALSAQDGLKGQIPVPLDSIDTREALRFDSGMEEINRVLGGGIMKGSSILLGGEPGIGKSTLMLQLASLINTRGRILYISGEESPAQLRMRADRLQMRIERIEVFSGTELSGILKTCNQVKPVLVVVDSIQTIHSADIGSVPGTLNQVKLCSQELIDWTKARDSALFLIGHVTKEGSIAGPKVIEHMVDTVLYFDTGSSEIRLLRATKNRFGPVDEIGIFQMTERGLTQVQDPASLFLTHRRGEPPPGVAVAPVYEGSRVLLVEIQSLVVPAKGGISRVFSDRIDSGRVSRMAAVLEKHLRLRFSDQDIYVNVGGGIRISEVGIELPLSLALYSARTGQPLPALTAVLGEVSLAGEIRPVSHQERRIKAVAEMGYQRLIQPEAEYSGKTPAQLCCSAATINEAVRNCFNLAG